MADFANFQEILAIFNGFQYIPLQEQGFCIQNLPSSSDPFYFFIYHMKWTLLRIVDISSFELKKHFFLWFDYFLWLPNGNSWFQFHGCFSTKCHPSGDACDPPLNKPTNPTNSTVVVTRNAQEK